MLRQLICFALCLGTTFMLNAQQLSSTVTVEQGKLSGKHVEHLHQFFGVPYAEPPVGQLRWQPPQKAQNWLGIKQVHTFENQCMQKYLYDDMRFRSKGVSEDCLYLNIWTPDLAPTEKLPVLVYFYGGGFRAGDGSEPRYDGAALAKKGIVVVTVNYRLGIFGLLAHPSLSAQSGYGGSGNYTFLDQQAALEWVNKNISQFGGDPTRVTIGGESAGSISVSAHMVAPDSKGLFSAAIGQSGSILGPPLPAVSLQKAHEMGVSTVNQLHNKLSLKVDRGNIEQLREVSAETLLDALEELGISRFSTTVDGRFIKDLPISLYRKGQFAKVPLLAGVNSQESHYTSIVDKPLVTKEDYQQAIRNLYPEYYQEVLAMFNISEQEDIKDALQTLASDRFISFGAWAWIDAVTHHPSVSGKQPSTYFYRYDHIRPARKVSEGGTGEHHDRGAVHSAEIEYVFGNLDNNPLYLWQPEDYQVSKVVQGYFERFIKTHDPNGEGQAFWPTFSSEKWMILSKEPEYQSFEAHIKRYQFFMDYYYPSN
ncbi:carboxylesterase family protein [Aliiglaciecola sp. M165]|nr:carboxylesterase family protein [Aliiglaciecola sp. M165]